MAWRTLARGLILASERWHPLARTSFLVRQNVVARGFWGWFNSVFNRVDPARVAEVRGKNGKLR